MKLKVFITETPIGKGVFASINIQKKDIVIESRQVDTVPQRNKYSLELNGEHVIIDEPGVFVNHSCEPNCILVPNEFGGFSFIANKNITKDEEITFDYLSIESEVVAFKECLCGTGNCRKNMILP